MRYIDSWLTGLGLEYIIPKLKANGITTPKKLAQLTLRDMYEVGKYILIIHLHSTNVCAYVYQYISVSVFISQNQVII